MKVTRIFAVAIATMGLAGFSSVASADAAAGKATFEKVCAECHEVADFEGEDTAEVTATIKAIVAGTQKHKKALKLTDAEIASVATFMTTGK